MDKKFLRIIDKGCAGINGALHVDAIKRFEIEEDGGFNIYAYTDSQRCLVNGYGSRMEAEEFMSQMTDPVDFDIEYKVREKCRLKIFSLFKDRMGFDNTLKFDDVCDMMKHDFVDAYCDETLEELVNRGYLVEYITQGDNDNEYFCPHYPTHDAIRNMVSRAFNNVIINDSSSSQNIKASLSYGCQMYYPHYPKVWVEQLFDLMMSLGYIRDITDEERSKIMNVGVRDVYDVFVVSRPESTYDEEQDATWYNIDAFWTAIEERSRK